MSTFWKKYPSIVVIVAAAWPVVTALGTAWWAVHKFEVQREDTRNAQDKERERLESEAAKTRKIEAQKPFLEKKLALYFQAIQTTSKLVDWNISPTSEVWKDTVRRFWEFRWAELEMVGDSGIRQAARRVGQQIVEVEADPTRDRHDLRWMIECFADELRLSLEHAWGFDPLATRITATGEPSSKLPNGCTQDRSPPPAVPGTNALVAPNNRQQ